MAALVQSYPQQSSTVTMLQTRPASASGILQPTSQSQSHHQFSSNTSHRNSFHGIGAMQLSNYRGQSAMTAVAPYSFAGSAGMSMGGQWSNTPHLQSNQRTTSAPIVPNSHQHDGGHGRGPRYPAQLSVSTTSSSSSDLSSFSHRSGSKDDSVIAGTARVATRAPRPQSTFITSTSTPNLAPPILMTSGKAAPDRYRRPGNRRNDSSTNMPASSHVSTASIPNVVSFYGNAAQAAKPDSLKLNIPQFSGQASGTDTQLGQVGPQDQSAAKRYRRRSIHSMDASELGHVGASSSPASQAASRQLSSADGRIGQQQHSTDQQQHPLRSSPVVKVRPGTSHGRNESTDSIRSTHSSQHSRPGSVSYNIRKFSPIMQRIHFVPINFFFVLTR